MGAGNPTTLVIRGEGGGLTIEDIPTAPARREVFDAYVAKGLYRILGLAPEGAEIDRPFGGVGAHHVEQVDDGSGVVAEARLLEELRLRPSGLVDRSRRS